MIFSSENKYAAMLLGIGYRSHPAAFTRLAPSAMLAPPMTPLITNSGKSQVALHGDIHDPVETLDNGREKKRTLNLPIDGSAQRTGMRPVGSRSAGWAVSNRMIEFDLLYDIGKANPTCPGTVTCTPVPFSPPGTDETGR